MKRPGRGFAAGIYRLIKRGELKGHKVGKKWVFYKRDLKDFLERKAYRPGAVD